MAIDIKQAVNIILLLILLAILFAFLVPGSIFTIPGNTSWLSIGKKEVNTWAILVHMLIFVITAGGFIVFYNLVASRVIETIFFQKSL